MTLTTWRDGHGRLVKEWHCCGHVWQLIVTRQFPERAVWEPVCQTCVISVKFQQRLKTDLFRQFLRWRLAYEDEIRQPHFAEFLWIFDRQIVRKEWVCRRCTNRRERTCIYGRQQGFQCLAYWWWQQPATTTQKIIVQEIPLEESWLQYLSHIQLLGIFYVRQFSLKTVGDFSKVGLRSRLLQIQNLLDKGEDFL